MRHLGHQGHTTLDQAVMGATRRSLMVTICAGALVACGGGDDTGALGAEGSPCYPNNTCDHGLTCLSTFCVRVVLEGGSDAGFDGGTNPAVDGATSEGTSDGDMTDATDATPPDATFIPAAHPVLPQVGNQSGPVLVSPKVQPIIYASDTAAADIEAFLQELTRT